MKFRVLMAGIILLFSATTALSAGPYVGVSGGATFVHEGDVTVSGVGTATAEYNPGFSLAASAGYKFNNPFRVEFEFGYKKADMDKLSGPGGSVDVPDTDITVMSYMVNGFVETNVEDNVTVYLGAGVGLLNGELNSLGESADENEFGYQVILGALYPINKNFALDFSYRFQHAPSDFSESGVDIEYMSSNVLLGLRYSF